VIGRASLSPSGHIVRVGSGVKGLLALPAAGAVDLAFIVPGPRLVRTALTPAAALARLIIAGLRFPPGAGRDDLVALLAWLDGLTSWDVILPTPQAAIKTDDIAAAVADLCALFEHHGVWYSLAYGTLLGALRDGDVIPWDYDFDLLVKPQDARKIMALGKELGRDGYALEYSRRPGSFLAVNLDALPHFHTSAIGVSRHGRKIGDLYLFQQFSDGVLRRFDFFDQIYWCPHSSFPAWFVEERSEVTLRGRRYAAVRAPEKWIEGVYGADWRTPYRAVAQGGASRDGATVHGDRYEPKLAAEVAWCREQGWDPSRYADAPAWPRVVRGAGPIGPTPRTADTSRALWWRDLDELVQTF
jgi:hypothetical protein